MPIPTALPTNEGFPSASEDVFGSNDNGNGQETINDEQILGQPSTLGLGGGNPLVPQAMAQHGDGDSVVPTFPLDDNPDLGLQQPSAVDLGPAPWAGADGQVAAGSEVYHPTHHAGNNNGMHGPEPAPIPVYLDPHGVATDTNLQHNPQFVPLGEGVNQLGQDAFQNFSLEGQENLQAVVAQGTDQVNGQELGQNQFPSLDYATHGPDSAQNFAGAIQLLAQWQQNPASLAALHAGDGGHVADALGGVLHQVEQDQAGPSNQASSHSLPHGQRNQQPVAPSAALGAFQPASANAGSEGVLQLIGRQETHGPQGIGAENEAPQVDLGPANDAPGAGEDPPNAGAPGGSQNPVGPQQNEEVQGDFEENPETAGGPSTNAANILPPQPAIQDEEDAGELYMFCEKVAVHVLVDAIQKPPNMCFEDFWRRVRVSLLVRERKIDEARYGQPRPDSEPGQFEKDYGPCETVMLHVQNESFQIATGPPPTEGRSSNMPVKNTNHLVLQRSVEIELGPREDTESFYEYCVTARVVQQTQRPAGIPGWSIGITCFVGLLVAKQVLRPSFRTVAADPDSRELSDVEYVLREFRVRRPARAADDGVLLKCLHFEHNNMPENQRASHIWRTREDFPMQLYVQKVIQSDSNGCRPIAPSGRLQTRFQRDALYSIRRRFARCSSKEWKHLLQDSDLYPLFMLGRDECARAMGTCPTWLKVRLRERGVKVWPNRRLIATTKQFVCYLNRERVLQEKGNLANPGEVEELQVIRSQKIPQIRRERLEILRLCLSPGFFEAFCRNAPKTVLDPVWECLPTPTRHP